MEVKNCRSCKRLFNYIGGEQLCSECKQKLEEKFNDVKEYIREHPAATLNEISEENDVSVKQLNQWVREERLAFTDDSIITFECENCGTAIRTGRFCDKCKSSMAHGLGSVYHSEPVKPEKKERDRDRMRFLQNM